jgi:hypothetical protein
VKYTMAREGKTKQTVTPRGPRRVRVPRPRNSTIARIGRAVAASTGFVKPAGLLVGAVLVMIGYNALAESRLFALKQVEVSNTAPGVATEIEKLVRQAVGQTRLLSIDLAGIKERVEALPRVRSASVARVLPNSLRINVVERKPVVLVRRKSGQVVWLDEDAVEIGDVSQFALEDGKGVPPIARGFTEGTRTPAGIAEDRERIAVYRQIEQEFSEDPNPKWGLVDEIDLSFTKDVNLRLANSIVTIHVGGKDYRNRFETALQILGAIKQGDAEKLSRFRIRDPQRLIQNSRSINFVDAARPDRIVINLSTPGTEKAGKQEKK